MFVTRELVVDAEFGAARARLKQIVRAADGDGLVRMSRTAYEEALAYLTRDDAPGDAPVVSTLVDVRLMGPLKLDDLPDAERSLLHHHAPATIRSLLRGVADALAR